MSSTLKLYFSIISAVFTKKILLLLVRELFRKKNKTSNRCAIVSNEAVIVTDKSRERYGEKSLVHKLVHGKDGYVTGFIVKIYNKK